MPADLKPVEVKKDSRVTSAEVTRQVSVTTAFLAGAAAGLTVDIALFPLDTLKTRLQSHHGFWKSGGFRGIYQGIGPVIITSAPTAAIFFATYNSLKKFCQPYVKPYQEPFVHFAAAATAEVVSCIVRVPSEVVKQRRQACLNETSGIQIVKSVLQREGPLGMYRGFISTILRDIPYAGLQFPLWEIFKVELATYLDTHSLTPTEGALCGAFAGMVAGALTTPLDVIKTRLVLYDVASSKRKKPPRFFSIAKLIYKEQGLRGFMSGFAPRVVGIFLGGAIFFGVYDEGVEFLEPPPPVKKPWYSRFIPW